MASFVQDPNARLDYTWDWSGLASGTGEQLTTVAVTSDDPAITVSDVTVASPLVTAWVSGGSPGATGRVTCRVVTSQGRQDDRTIVLYFAEM